MNRLRNWLTRQEWDGVHRLGTWLAESLGTHNTPYLAAVGRHIVIAHAARAMRPGIAFGHAILLYGPPGLGKSSLIATLVGGLHGDAPIDPNSTDSIQALSEAWAYEITELEALNKAEHKQLKVWLGLRADSYRPAYSSRVEVQPRNCVFWITTNSRQVLVDAARDRNLWPIEVTGTVRHAWLSMWRGQLFAEALAHVGPGTLPGPSYQEERAVFEPERARLLALYSRPPLDLDAMCAAARTRLTAEVQHSASMALADQHRESAAIRQRMNQALQLRRMKATEAMFRLEVGPVVKDLVRFAAALRWPFQGSIGGMTTLSNGGRAK